MFSNGNIKPSIDFFTDSFTSDKNTSNSEKMEKSPSFKEFLNHRCINLPVFLKKEAIKNQSLIWGRKEKKN